MCGYPRICVSSRPPGHLELSGEPDNTKTKLMQRITVYTKPACPQCRATPRALERAGLDYEAVDISADTQARDFVMSLGHLQAPS